ncbi:MAG: hypothetical protein AB7U63_08010 [Porticoccaceae bacterium]
MATPTENAIQEIYLGLLGRPADAAGLAYWANDVDNNGMSLAGVRFNIVNEQPEYEDVFGGLSRSQTVNQLYLNLFNRNAEPAGLEYWVNGGGSTVPIDLLVFALSDGAGGPDRLVLDNKVAVANYITASPNYGVLSTAEVDAILDTVGASNVNAVIAAYDAAVAEAQNPVGETFVLTAGQDNFTGTAKADTFLSTQNTLQNGDVLDGGDGNDTLVVSVGGNNDFFAAPDISNIETIRVNAPNNNGIAIELDLSNADGYNTLESFQVTSYTGSGSFVGFYDIQNVNGTDIRIIDTNVDHEFTYDTNGYVRTAGGVAVGNAIDLYLSEVDGSELVFGNDVPYTPYQSEADQINITSAQRTQVSTTTFNTLSGLYVGDMLNTVIIDGNADFEVEDFLDLNVNLVDAGALGDLNADLTLSLHAQGVVLNLDGTVNVAATTFLNVVGAHGDDDIYIGGARSAGINVVDLGTGDDYLHIDLDASHSFITTGEGDDSVELHIERGLLAVDLGEGDDYLEIWGDVDDLTTTALNDGVSTVVAGAGNDTVVIDAANSYQGSASNDFDINLGEGDDDLSITSHGNQLIDAGAGDDIVVINGNGIHDIDLGEGDDFLHINGSRDATGTLDNANPNNEPEYTVIVGGEGNDTVIVDAGLTNANGVTAGNGATGAFDHYLDVDLGEGDDVIQVRTQDLTADDIINGGEGSDTLVLTNKANTKATGSVGASETGSVTSIETFDLRDHSITLKLTNDNFDTAEDRDITVRTEQSSTVKLPSLTVASTGAIVNPITSGMSYQAWLALEAEWEAGVYLESNGPEFLPNNDPNPAYQTLQAFLFSPQGGVQAIDFADNTGDGDSLVIESETTLPAAQPNRIDPQDKVFFVLDQDVEQVVDLTGVALSAASGRSFSLLGGGIRDVVIADDASINGRLNLRFDNSGANNATDDTLQVRDGATITAADLRNVTGLEILELIATQNNSQTWNIELTDTVINQTTGSADLIIRVDPTVPAGSRVNITTDASTPNALNGVIVENNGNVDIYIDGVLATGGSYVGGVITVVTPLFFTNNVDDLEGTIGNDLFIANSLNQLDEADFADGLAGDDTLQLNFAVANPNQGLWVQLNNVGLDNIEEILFNTGNAVRMDGIGLGQFGDVETITSGSGNDVLNDMRLGLTYNLGAGNDYISLSALDGGAGTTTVNGGTGSDTVDVSSFGATYAIDVELINGTGVNNTITIEQNVDNGNVTVNGFGGGSDLLNIVGAIGGTVTTSSVETINDSNAGNTIVATGNGVGSGNVTANLFDGNDTLTITNANTATVTAETGTNTITIGAGVTNANITGGTGVNTGVDIINVTVSNNATVNSGDGDDVITVNANNAATVNGGAGADIITVNVDGANIGGSASVEGGTGNDILNVYTQNTETSTVVGGAGNDTINLNDIAAGGVDLIRFGTIDYDELQVVTPNNDTQGLDVINNFNFEGITANNDPLPTGEDLMNFTAFLGGTADNRVTVSGNWNGTSAITADASAGNAVVVVSAPGKTLQASDFGANGFGGAIQLNDNGKAVVVVGTNPSGIGTGIDQFDIYYVQDTSSGAGQTWAVDKVATVNSLTAVGIEEVMDNLVDGLAVPPPVLPNIVAGVAGGQVMNATAAEDHFVLATGAPGAVTVYSVAPTASTGLTGAADAATVGDTLVYAAGVDAIIGFEQGVDKLDVVTPGAPINAFGNAQFAGPAGAASDLDSSAAPYVLYGNWDQVTNTFTVAQDWTAVTADALVIQGVQGFDPIQESLGATVVVGLNTALVAADFM